MKLCFAIQSLAIGGSSQVVIDLIYQIKLRKDTELSLIVFFDIIDEKYRAYLDESGVNVYVLNKKNGFDLPFLYRLKKTIEKINPDIISSHLTCTFYLNLVVNFKKTVICHTIHNIPSADLPSVYRMFLMPHIRDGKIRLICCHEGLAPLARGLYGVECYSVNNGINVQNNICFSTSSKRKFDVLMACRMTSVKRPEFFVSLIKILVDSGLNDIKAVVAGDGPNLFRASELATELGIDGNISFLGNVSDMTPLFKESKIFVLTSTREGAPISILEANSFGLPVVASAVGAVPNMIEQGYNGFVYDKDDINSAAGYLKKLLSDQALLDDLSRNSYSLASKRDAKSMADGYYNIFVSLVKRD